MSYEQDRIKLAEAMGWRRINDEDLAWWSPEERLPSGTVFCDYVGLSCLPDPFTDANDDYAVLEWLRSRRDLPPYDMELWRKFMAVIHKGAFSTTYYQIGDYARAALKALEVE